MTKRAFFGVALIIVGALFILAQTEIYDVGSLLSVYWPVILIVAGLYSLIVSTAPPFGGIILLLLGIWFQLARLDLLPENYGRFVLPGIIIIIGLWIIFTRKTVPEVSTDSINYFTIFSGLENRNISKDFKGGNITALFGGVDLDLRDTILVEKAMIDVFVAFGGADIKVPENWKVEITGLPLFGGWSNKAKNNKQLDNAPLLKIRCFAAFGGVDIKN